MMSIEAAEAEVVLEVVVAVVAAVEAPDLIASFPIVRMRQTWLKAGILLDLVIQIQVRRTSLATPTLSQQRHLSARSPHLFANTFPIIMTSSRLLHIEIRSLLSFLLPMESALQMAALRPQSWKRFGSSPSPPPDTSMHPNFLKQMLVPSILGLPRIFVPRGSHTTIHPQSLCLIKGAALCAKCPARSAVTTGKVPQILKALTGDTLVRLPSLIPHLLSQIESPPSPSR